MDPNARRTRRASSFGAAATEYERGRPLYPDEAIEWLLAGGGNHVLDLGAGTGKLTRQLVDRGLDVVAVEPSDAMRDQLAGAVPRARLLAGSAEQIPLADGCVDTVLVAQAWHWVDPLRATAEAARVLTPGGWLGLLWNIRDESHEWVAELGLIMHPDGQRDGDPKPVVGAPFGPLQRRDVRWRHRLTAGSLLDLAASRSHVIMLPPDQRAALLASVSDLVATHPALAGRDEFELPYVTHCFRAQLQ